VAHVSDGKILLGRAVVLIVSRVIVRQRVSPLGEPDDRLRLTIQYAAAYRFNHVRHGILGCPVKPAMTVD
jgi:hypothetical protein